jgi:hypothetical protein
MGSLAAIGSTTPDAAPAALNLVDVEAPIVDLNEGIAEVGQNPFLEAEYDSWGS